MPHQTSEIESNPPEMSPIIERIREGYGEFTPGERRLADAILSVSGELSQYPAFELAEQAQVSKATAARFFRKLGYANFKEARLSARQNKRWGSPLEALHSLTAPLQARGDLGQHLANDIRNLSRSAENWDAGQIDSAVELLATAERVYVIGFRNSHVIAMYGYTVLSTLRPHVKISANDNMNLPEFFAGLGPKDVVLSVGFRRRPKLLARILRMAQECKAKTVLITDESAKKTVEAADIVFNCENQGAYLFDSYVTAMSLINFICSALATKLGNAAWNRMENIETLHDRLHDLAD